MARLRVQGGDGTYSHPDFCRLLAALDEAIVAETEHGGSGEEHLIDRAAIRAAFDDNGFAGFYLGIDFGAEERRFTRQLERTYMQFLPGFIAASRDVGGARVIEGPVICS